MVANICRVKHSGEPSCELDTKVQRFGDHLCPCHHGMLQRAKTLSSLKHDLREICGHVRVEECVSAD